MHRRRERVGGAEREGGRGTVAVFGREHDYPRRFGRDGGEQLAQVVGIGGEQRGEQRVGRVVGTRRDLIEMETGAGEGALEARRPGRRIAGKKETRPSDRLSGAGGRHS